jgi:hypothetical protein
MTPEELAKYRAEKVEKEQRAAAEQERRADAERSQFQSDTDAAKAAIGQKIIPYLNRVKTAMNGAITFAPMVNTDHEPVGVDLRMDNRKASIKMFGSTFQCYIDSRRPPYGAIPFTGIRSIADITDDKLGQFIKAMIDTD